MGVCCSKTAKETGASSPRHYVSVSGSPSLFPTENEHKQDSALARGIEETRSRLKKAVEKASVVNFNEKSSRSASIVHPAWEAKHRPGEKKDSWVNLVHKPRSNGQWSEQSSTENQDDNNKVILLKSRCSGAMRRLKKKDSKRPPKYKDEIMLTDNIDSIVEREIPEVPDDARSLAESPGPGCSHAGITRPSSSRSKMTEVMKLARSNEPNAKSTTASIAGAIQGPKEIYAKKRSRKACDETLLKKEDIEECDLESFPLAISSVSTSQLEKNCAQRTMDEEDIRVAEEIKNMLKDECLNFSNEQRPPSAGKAPKLTRKRSSSKEKYVKPLEEVVEEADVKAPTASSSSQMLKDSLQNLSAELGQLNNGKNSANEVNCALKGVVPAAEMKGQISAGRVLPPKNRKRLEENSTMQKKLTEEEILENDIEYVLNYNIPATESNGHNSTGKVSPPKKRQRPKDNSAMQKETTEEDKLAADNENILNDDVPATESNGQNSTSRVLLTKQGKHPKKETSISKKGNDKVADDIDHSLTDHVQVPKSTEQVTAGTVSSKVKAQEAKKKSVRENKLKVDKNIAKDVKDNIPMAEEVKSPTFPRKVLTKKEEKEKVKRRASIQESEQADDNLAKVVKDGSNAKVTSGLGALPPPTKGFTRKHSKHADEQLAKDVEHILHEDDIFAVEPEVTVPYSPRETQRPKTRNPKRWLAMEMDRIFDPESIDCSPLAEEHEKVDGMSNKTLSSSTGAAPRPRNKDIEDDVFAVEPEVTVPYSPRETQRPKTRNPKRTLAMEMDRIFDPESIDCSLLAEEHEKVDGMSNKTLSSSTGAAPRPRNKDIVDDVFAVEPEVAVPYRPNEAPRPKTRNPKRWLAMEMGRIFDPGSIDCSPLAEDHKTVYGISNATVASSTEAAPRPRNKDIVDDVFAVEPEVAVPYRPSETPRPKTRNPKRWLAMEMEKILDPESIDCSPLAEDHEKAAGILNATVASSTGAAPCPRNKTRKRTLKYMTIAEGTALQPISPSSGLLPRPPKTRNPKRMSANNNQSLSPAASSSRTVILPKQDSLRKPKQAPQKLAKDGFVQDASNVQMASTASSGSRTNSRNNSTKKSKDTLILDDVESGEQIPISTCTVTRPPKISHGEQKHAEDVIATKKSDDKLKDTKVVASIGSNASSVRAGTRLRKEHPTRQPKETHETILEIPTRVSGASAENHTDVAESIKKKNSSTQSNNVKDIEEFNLDKAIEDILGIPAAEFGASVENRTDFAANLKEKNSTAQPSKSKHTEEMDLDEAIEETSEISTLCGDTKQAAEPNNMSKERKKTSRTKVTCQSHGMDTKKPTVQTTSVPDAGFPDSKTSLSGVETMNCDSECSVASGDTMRPMAAGSSGVKTLGGSASSKTVKLPSSHSSTQQSWKVKQRLPSILLKEKTIVRKPRMRASRKTTEPSLGGLQGMENHRNAAVPVTSGNNSGMSPEIFYEPQELELMKQIERQFPCSLRGMETRGNATVPVTSGNNSGISPRIFYEPHELELMKQIERQFPCC